MNTLQLLNPDLNIPNNLARFIKKWGFIRMPNQYDHHPRFLKATANNVFELVFIYNGEEPAFFWEKVFLNEKVYRMKDKTLIKTLKESR